MTTIAVLGTGVMGAPMARNWARAGHQVRAWNRTRAKAEPLAADGVGVCATPADAARGAEVLVTMLHDAVAVADVAAQALPALPRDAVWLQTSTVGLDGGQRLAALAQEHDIAYVESPVLGTREPAEQGSLTALATAPAELRERLAPVLTPIASRTVWFDRPGDGMRAKLVLNSWVLALTEAAAEAMALAEAFGLDPLLLPRTVAGGPLDAGYLQTKTALMAERRFPASFPLRGAAKDAGLIVDAARELGVDMAVTEAVARRMALAVELGHADEDMAATYLGQRPTAAS